LLRQPFSYCANGQVNLSTMLHKVIDGEVTVNLIISPSPDQIIQNSDKLVVIGNRKGLIDIANIE
jgi:hypothetical protein